MTKSTYDEECSERAFLDVGGSKLGGGLATLRSCMASNESIGYLEDEVKAQVTSDVVILPSIIIQGHQYRGALHAGSVLKALCAALQARSTSSLEADSTCIAIEMIINTRFDDQHGQVI